MALLTPAVAVGPGYALYPGSIPGVYSWPGKVPGINLAPEGFFPLGASPPALAQDVTVGLSSVQSGTLTPASPLALGLATDAATSTPLTPASVQSAPLDPA